MTWLLALLPALLFQAPSPEVARVGSTTITRADVEARLAVMREKGDFGGPLDAVNGLVGEALLEAEARRLGLAASPVVKAKVEREHRRLAGELLVERDLAANAKPTEAELRELYHSKADSVRLDLLVFESEAAAGAAAKKIAQGGDFSAEAAGAVAHPPAALTMRAQVDPKLVTAAFQAPLGAVQGPAAASVGLAVFRVTERVVGDEAGFQVQRQALLEHASRMTVARARTHLVEQLRAKQGVKVDEAFLDALPRGGDATLAQSLRVLATVGGRAVTYGEILPAVQQLQAASGHPASGRVKKELAWQEIDTRLVEDLAMARGYGDDPQLKGRLPALQSAALAQALAEQLTAAAPAPTEAEVAAFYKKHEQEIGQPLDKARPTIRTRLTAEKRSEAILAKVRELRGRTDVQVNQAALSGLSPHG